MSDEPQVPEEEPASVAPAEALADEAPVSDRVTEPVEGGSDPGAGGNRQPVLNSEEVDALLQGLNQGEIPLNSVAGERLRVRPYDLANPVTGEWAPMPALDLIAEHAVPGFSSYLSRRLSFSVRGRSLPIQVRDFGRFIRSPEPPLAISILTMSPGEVPCVLLVEAMTVYRMIDLIFGGKPVESKGWNRRDFTRIEIRTIASIVKDMVGVLTNAWQEVAPVDFRWERLETRPQFASIAPANESCVLMHWEVDLGVGDGDQITLCIPSAALETIPQLREEIRPEEGAELRALFHKRLRASLQQVPLNLTVELGKLVMTVGEVRSLKVGDVLPMDKRPADPVVGLVEAVPKLLGTTGTYRGNRAVRIVKVMKKEVSNGR